MNIVACIKQVPDPETPATDYSIDQEAKKIVLPNDVPLVISPFDANAVEAGIELKEDVGGTLTVICLATTPAPEAIRDLSFCRGRQSLHGLQSGYGHQEAG